MGVVKPPLPYGRQWLETEEESAVLRDLKLSIGKDVTIKPDVQLHHEQFDVMAV